MAKPRKKNNPVKRYEAQARCAVNGLCFGMRPGDTSGKVDCWKLSTGKITPVGPTVAKALGDCHFKFAFLLVVISQEANGKQRIVTEYNRVAAPYKHSDLVHYLNDKHDAILSKEVERGNDVVVDVFPVAFALGVLTFHHRPHSLKRLAADNFF